MKPNSMSADLSSAMPTKEEIVRAIRDESKGNLLVLPALPEIAVKARATVEDPAASALQMAKLISGDPALAARLLQVANTALYRSRSPVASIQGAVARLGIKMIRNLVTALVMEQLYKVKSSARIRPWQIEIWKHSTHVAALSSVFASRFTSLPPDEALLGGLIHDIGKLPVLRRAESFPALLANNELLTAVLDDLHCEIGELILRTWGIPDMVVRCAGRHEHGDDSRSPEIDICDIVTIANFCSHMGNKWPEFEAVFDRVPVLKKLDTDLATIADILDEAADEIRAIEQLLS